MTRFIRTISAVAAAVALGLSANAASAQSSPGHGQGGHAGQATAPAGMDMKAMMKENDQKMASMPMTGNQDVDFAMMMRMHHMGAIQMAEMELKNGKDPQLREMVRKIIADQKKEIAQFEQFLAKNGHPVDKMK